MSESSRAVKYSKNPLVPKALAAKGLGFSGCRRRRGSRSHATSSAASEGVWSSPGNAGLSKSFPLARVLRAPKVVANVTSLRNATTNSVAESKGVWNARARGRRLRVRRPSRSSEPWRTPTRPSLLSSEPWRLSRRSEAKPCSVLDLEGEARAERSDDQAAVNCLATDETERLGTAAKRDDE
jgi:hypothetical protein